MQTSLFVFSAKLSILNLFYARFTNGYQMFYTTTATSERHYVQALIIYILAYLYEEGYLKIIHVFQFLLNLFIKMFKLKPTLTSSSLNI